MENKKQKEEKDKKDTSKKEKKKEKNVKKEEKKKVTKTNLEKENEKKVAKTNLEKENDKKVTKKPEKKGKHFNKIAKWVTIVITISIIITTIIGIVFFIKSPYFAVMKTFNSIKKGDITTINNYLSYEELKDSLVIGLNVGNNMGDIEKKCFEEMRYRIKDINTNGDKAIVEVETTNKNFRNALTKLTQAIYQKFINGEDISNEQGVTILSECLSDSTIGTMTVSKELNLNKVDGKWKIIIDENLRDALFPGLSEVVNSIDALTSE